VGKRQDARDRIERRIIELGRQHLVTEGAGGLSLRAIARDLGMVSSAVYRYVGSRDELLTLLLVDAYTELADEVERARESAGESWRAQLREMATAARRWAVSRPASWALLYGSPVPGYHAPRERTVGPGTRVVGSLLAVVAGGVAAGDIPAPKLDVSQELSADLAAVRAEFAVTLDDAVTAKCLVVWSSLVGAISLEVFGQYGQDTFGDPAAAFDTQVRVLTDLLGQG
jgi:AcrR family transcriptional regulator